MVFLAGVLSACGGARENANYGDQVSLSVTSAYYITEVAGTPNTPSTNKYLIEFDSLPDGLHFDSLYVNDVLVEMMRMKNRPVIYGASASDDFTGLLELLLVGAYQNERFELKLDSVYQKEQVFLPANRPEE